MAEKSEKFILENAEKLVEKWSDVIECKGDWSFLKSDGMSLSEGKKAEMAVMCEQIEQSVRLRESTVTADIQKYDPILIPVMRRVMPALIAGDIYGVQPLSAPTGLIFALRAVYQGDRNSDNLKWSPTLSGVNNQILVFTTTASSFPAKGSTLYLSTTTAATAGQVAATAAVVHMEEQGSKLYVLVKGVSTGAAIAGSTYYVSSTVGSGTYTDVFATGLVSEGQVYTSYTNEMQFKTILQGYSGGTKLASGYNAGGYTGYGATDGFSEYVNEVGFAIDKTNVTVASRKLKTRWTMELEEDLNAVHSINAEKTLQQIATEEISQGMNREMLEILDAYALQNALTGVNDFNYSLSDGRWEKERYESLANHINRVRRKLAVENRRGQANFMVVTYDLLTALEGTGRLSTSGNDPYTNPFVGTLDGMKVYCDIYRTGQEITLGYKGPAQIDAGFFYCPYIPLKINKGMGQEDNNPRLFFSTRYGVGANPFGAQNYFCKIKVTGTIGQASAVH